MRRCMVTVMGLLLLGATVGTADEHKPDFSGTWKLDVERSQLDQTSKGFMLIVEDKGPNIHVKETRGPDLQEDVSEFTCGTMGADCSMQDGKEKATVSAYYNGSMLVILKTHGRKGSQVEKQRLSLAPGGDSLTMEVMHIEPEGKPEKLVLSKVQ